MSESRPGMVAAGCAAVIGVWLWLGGGLAAWLFGSGWISVAPAELVVIARLRRVSRNPHGGAGATQ